MLNLDAIVGGVIGGLIIVLVMLMFLHARWYKALTTDFRRQQQLRNFSLKIAVSIYLFLMFTLLVLQTKVQQAGALLFILAGFATYYIQQID